MAIQTVQDMFLDELKDIYSAEKQAIKMYPKLAKAVQSPELKQALQTHLEESKEQVSRLEKAFEILGKRGTGKTCEGMKGVLEESTEAVEKIEQGPVRDAAMIAAAQRVEHYEIAAYGTVVALAKLVDEQEILQLLSQTLEEEKATDKKLTGISKIVNKLALSESAEDEEEEEPEEEGGGGSEGEEGEEGEEEGEEEAPAKAAKKGGRK